MKVQRRKLKRNTGFNARLASEKKNKWGLLRVGGHVVVIATERRSGGWGLGGHGKLLVGW